MANWNHLPEEVIVEILSRLPVESLLRFQVVHKSWYHLIHHPKFKAKHLVNSRQHRNLPNSSASILLSYPVTDDQSIMGIDLPDFKNPVPLRIVGHSHGIVCLSDTVNVIVLSNPATREFRHLPPPIELLIEQPEPEDPYGYINSTTVAVAFGYDPKSRDFKVVRVVNFLVGRSILLARPTRVEVYNLSTDRWREMENNVNAFKFGNPPSEMYHRGIYYWLDISDITYKETILSFDMSEEVFRQTPVPECFEQARGTMGVLNGSIVLFHYPMSEDEKYFDIWEMEKNELGGVSWLNILRIGPLSGIHRPLIFVSSDELLMETIDWQVVAYNVKTQELTKLAVNGLSKIYDATVFTESLLSVKGGNKLDLGAASEIM